MCVQGVLRVHVIEAKDLKRADISITGRGKSDPYATITGEEAAVLLLLQTMGFFKFLPAEFRPSGSCKGRSRDSSEIR